MAASDFNYADYLLYAAAQNVNHSLYATVAHGVLGTLTSQYGIYAETETLTYQRFIEETTFDLLVVPVTAITSITYDGTEITTDGYAYYGRDVKLVTALIDYDVPLDIVAEVGYTILPTDLKLAIYRHIDAIIFAINKDTDSVDKVTNSTGNTTYYRSDVIPIPVQSVYEFYSARLQVLG